MKYSPHYKDIKRKNAEKRRQAYNDDVKHQYGRYSADDKESLITEASEYKSKGYYSYMFHRNNPYDPRSKYTREKKTQENRQAYIEAVKRQYEREHEQIKNNGAHVKNNNVRVKNERTTKKPRGLYYGRPIHVKDGRKGYVEKWTDREIFIVVDGRMFRGSLDLIGKTVFLD